MFNFFTHSNILNNFATDAYKASHFLQLPPDSEATSFYIAPRKSFSEHYPHYIIFGIRYFIERYLTSPITQEDLDESRKIWDYFNVDGSAYTFPVNGFQKIIKQYNGYLPITITGVKEGQCLDSYNSPVFIVSVDDPDLVWLPGFIETALQRSVWYMSTVATNSYIVKQIISKGYKISVNQDQQSSLLTRLHDFGARGASSGESSAIGGLAHLLNFVGTDNMESVFLGHYLYGTAIPELACSIPAAEHSTVTSWGEDNEGERKSLFNLIEQSYKCGDKVFAFVSDSYDYYHTVDHIWGDPQVKEKILAYGLSPVVRPDSGDPTEVVLYTLHSLARSWGYTTNQKGFKVLNTIRIIQGDGMSITRIQNLIDAIITAGFSVENVSFGMGGGLLQKVNRDTMSWAMKMYKIKRNGTWYGVQKKPSTQSDKVSFNPSNLVDDKEWVIHYQYNNMKKQIEVYKEPLKTIRQRTQLYWEE